MLSPGNDGDALPDGTLIFRIGKDVHLNSVAMEKRAALPGMFALSSMDKKSDGQRLSVWVEVLTIADQGWAFMGAQPKNTVVACLNVDEIRALSRQEPFDALNVQWEKATTSDGSPNLEPGANGHCGISGLNQGTDGNTDSKSRKAMRSMLADIARISPVPVPHNFPEEHLRVAAYFINENCESSAGDDSSHWVSAIRQARRALVREHGLSRA